MLCSVSVLQAFYLLLFAYRAFMDYTELGLVIPIYTEMRSCVSAIIAKLA